MTWWMWLILGWLVVACVLAPFIGQVARIGDERELHTEPESILGRDVERPDGEPY